MKNSDIWSTGCILYEIASLRPPFEATNSVTLGLKIKEGKFDRIPKVYSEELWRVITLMLAPNHEKRPAVEDLLNIPQVSLRLRERRLKDNFSKLKRREEEIKLKDSKFTELESELSKYKDDLAVKIAEWEEKDRLLRERDREIEELKAKLSNIESKNNTPPLIQSETPKCHGDRGLNFRTEGRLGNDNSSVYHSLKQEIRELSNQVSYDSSTQCRLKKQVSHIPSRADELFDDKKEIEIRKSCLSMKSKLGYKSVERKKRKYEDICNSKLTYEYTKDSYKGNNDNKENIRWANYNQSVEGLNQSKDTYTTPPFKSSKSKIPENVNTRVQTTSYRSRSNAYNEPISATEKTGSMDISTSVEHRRNNYPLGYKTRF